MHMAMLQMFGQGWRDRTVLPLLCMGRGMLLASTTIWIWNGWEWSLARWVQVRPAKLAFMTGEKSGQWQKPRWPKVEVDLQS